MNTQEIRSQLQACTTRKEMIPLFRAARSHITDLKGSRPHRRNYMNDAMRYDADRASHEARISEWVAVVKAIETASRVM